MTGRYLNDDGGALEVLLTRQPFCMQGTKALRVPPTSCSNLLLQRVELLHKVARESKPHFHCPGTQPGKPTPAFASPTAPPSILDLLQADLGASVTVQDWRRQPWRLQTKVKRSTSVHWACSSLVCHRHTYGNSCVQYSK